MGNTQSATIKTILVLTAFLLLWLSAGCGTSEPGATSTEAATPTAAEASKALTLVSQQYFENRLAAEPMTLPAVNAKANQLIVVLIATDGPPDIPQTITSVTGGGLAWKRAVQANALEGDSEVWYVVATADVANMPISATRSQAGCNTGNCNGLIGAIVFDGADIAKPIGAVGMHSLPEGTPSVSLTTTRAGSWVFGVGSDWDHAVPRTIGPGQTMGRDDNSTENDDEYWIQYMSAPTPAAGTIITLNDTAPADHQFDFAAVEILPLNNQSTP